MPERWQLKPVFILFVCFLLSCSLGGRAADVVPALDTAIDESGKEMAEGMT